MEAEITATVGIFSGRPNPEISLTGEAAERLAESVKEAIGREPAPPPAPARLGFYYGFVVRSPRDLARRLGLPEEFRVYQGVLTERMGREPRHWRDIAEVERKLIEQAYQQGYGEMLQRVGVDVSEPSRYHVR
jgi:hypothetical protein